MLWNSLRHKLLYLFCLRKMNLKPHDHGPHLCQSSMRRRRRNDLSLLSLIHNPTPLPTPSTDDPPMQLSHDDDTPRWIPTEQDTPAIIPQQVPSPPVGTCALVIQLFRRHFSSTKLHQHLCQSVGDLALFISRILCRSVGDPIRCILRLLFRPQRLHSFGGVQVFCVHCVHFEGFEANIQTLRK